MTGLERENMPSAPKPLVSIVVINHNYARFLHAAVDSALAQNCSIKEIIVFDDGSTDGSQEIIHSYGQKIRPVLHEHLGLIEAFNVAFSHATGSIVFFLDADDYLYPNCVETVLSSWTPGLSKIQFQLDTVDEFGADQSMPFPYFPADLDEEAVLAQSLRYGTYPWTVRTGNAYSAEFLKRVLPMDSTKIFKAPDGYVNKLAPLYGGVQSMNRRLGAYRVHGKNIWAQSSGNFRIGPIADNVRLDQVMYQIFKRHAAERGYEIRPFDEICLPNQVEIQLLELRFRPPDDAAAARTRMAHLRAVARRSVNDAPNTSVLGKLFWRLWFFLLSFAPLPIIAYLFVKIRSQAGRPALFRKAVQFARGPARVRKS